MRRWMRAILSVILTIGGSAGTTLAQGSAATISGMIRDQSGAVLPGAAIQVANQQTGRVRNVVTDTEGRYRVPALEVGTYDVQASLAGFKTALQKGVVLTVASEAVVDLALEVGQVAESLTVTAEVPAVQTTSAQLSGLVGDKEIRDLPLNGRSFEQLALLQPGVVLFTNQSQTITGRVQHGAGGKLAMGGTSSFFTSYLLDGAQIYDHTSVSLGSTAGDNLGVDGILEFRVLTHNYSAEYGRTAGGVVSAVTRSGTNQFHGSAFEFLRNNALDAREFFDPEGTNPFRRNQYGATLGGPIVRDRTFFFGNYEALRSRKTDTNVSTIPTAAAREGILPGPSGPRNVVVAPAIKPYLNLWPLPNGRVFPDGSAQLFWTFKEPTDEDYFMVRIDHQFSDRHFLTGRLTFNNAEGRTPQSSPGFFAVAPSRQILTLLEQKTIFTPQLLNVFRIAFNRTNASIEGGSDVPNNRELGFIPGRVWQLRFNAGGGSGVGVLSDLGNANQVPLRYPQNVFEYADDLDYQKGRHSVRIGFDLERIQLNATINGTQSAYQFQDLESLLVARPRQFQAQSLDSISNFGVRQWLAGFYVQDNLRTNDRLNLNLGLRYEIISVPDEVNGRRANIRDLLNDSQPTPGPLFENPSLRNFGPRFGFAWIPMRGGKSVVRGGFGIYHNQIMGRAYWQIARTGFQYNTQINNPPFPTVDLSNVPPGSANFFAYEQQTHTPTVYHYNLTVEQQLPGSLVLALGYAGSHGLHWFRMSEGNTRIPSFLPDGTPFYNPQGPRRNPRLGSLNFVSNDAAALYNSLQLQVTKQLSHGLRLQGSYTWSKALAEDTVYDAGVTSNAPPISMIPCDHRADRGYANYDQRHVFSFNYTYQFPGNSLHGLAAAFAKGWEMNGIARATSGLPLTVGMTVNQSGDGAISQIPDRPNLRAGASNNPVRGNVSQWYDPAAFEFPRPGFYGNLGRNTVIGPGVATFDLSLVKNFQLAERHTLVFRSEFFNLFNHANFGLPNRFVFAAGGAVVGNAGAIQTLTTSSRQIQFGLRYTF